ncbi:HEAT repeat domain-containing protein [Geopsychrobacter electrodiphilus]|uniref:HEAT repeat domain-containing protein n=1 Tax=Geopsychrobacter electrodiphilus TaxID=225196 RepID=UPI00037BA7B9|nr:HEAT repeat domain-containing protein [Geopsychrobacter electrodiphilus]
MAENQLILEIEQALTGLIKLLKALRFYPREHPSLHAAITDCMTCFKPLLTHQERRAIQSSQKGFTLGEDRIGEKNPALLDLAYLLAERRVNQIIFLSDLQAQELLYLADGLTTPAEEIYSGGGLQTFLRSRKVNSIWLNESSLDEALQKRQQFAVETEQAAEQIGMSALPPAEPPKAIDLVQQLRTLVEQLQIKQADEEYGQQIDQLLKLAPQYFEQSGAPGILRILPLLLAQSQQTERSPFQRDRAASALEHLLSRPMVDLLLAQFKSTTLTPQQYRRLQHLIIGLGLRIAPQMLEQIGREEASNVRNRLSSMLTKMGEPLLDLLREMIHSSKWYVVRNAVTLIGNLRLAPGITLLEPLVKHPDQRVRRALISALAMIGGDMAVVPLSLLAQDPFFALRRPAVKALGATRSNLAVPPLLAIAQQFDPFGRYTEIRRDAVSGLGLIGQKEVIAPLLSLAKRPNLLRRPRLEEFRAEIILTLGKLGDKNLDQAFERWRKSPHGVVQRAADLSLATLDKKHDHPAPN